MSTLYWVGGCYTESSLESSADDDTDFSKAANWKMAEIVSVDTANDRLTISGDWTDYLSGADGESIAIRDTDSGDEDGVTTLDITGYTPTEAGGNTTIQVDQDITTDTGATGYVGMVPRCVSSMGGSETSNIEFGTQAETDTSTGNHYSLDAGLDQSTKEFDTITRAIGFTGDIGTGLSNGSSGAGGLETYFDKLNIRGDGSYASFVIDSTQSSGSGEVVIDAESTLAIEFGTGDDDPQTISKITGTSGTVQFFAPDDSGTFTLGDIQLTEVQSLTSDFMLTIGEDANSAITTITQVAGTVTCNKGFTTWDIMAGVGSFGDGSYWPSSEIAAGTVNNYGGSFNWRLKSSLTISNYGGTAKATGTQAKTLTDGDVYGGTLDLLTEQQGDVVITNEVVMHSSAAEFKPPFGESISW